MGGQQVVMYALSKGIMADQETHNHNVQKQGSL